MTLPPAKAGNFTDFNHKYTAKIKRTKKVVVVDFLKVQPYRVQYPHSLSLVIGLIVTGEITLCMVSQ
jgi:hypothetical protein